MITCFCCGRSEIEVPMTFCLECEEDHCAPCARKCEQAISYYDEHYYEGDDEVWG